MHNANLFIYSILMNVRNGAAKYKFGNRVQCWCYPNARYYHLQQEYIQCFEINKTTIALWEWLDIPVDNLTHIQMWHILNNTIDNIPERICISTNFLHIIKHWNSKRYNWNWHCHNVCYLKYEGKKDTYTKSSWC